MMVESKIAIYYVKSVYIVNCILPRGFPWNPLRGDIPLRTPFS
jgi:hypothetical protein